MNLTDLTFLNTAIIAVGSNVLACGGLHNVQCSRNVCSKMTENTAKTANISDETIKNVTRYSNP